MDNNMKYYEAYEERYKTVHQKGISWASDKSTPIVMNVICRYCIRPEHELLEIGCGERFWIKDIILRLLIFLKKPFHIAKNICRNTLGISEYLIAFPTIWTTLLILFMQLRSCTCWYLRKTEAVFTDSFAII